MASVQEIIDARAPKFSAYPNLGALVVQADEETGAQFTGNTRNKAVALLTLHWLAMAERDSNGLSASGAISREKEGAVEREYLNDFMMIGARPDLSATAWGLELLRLRKENIFGPGTRFSTFGG